MVRIIIAALYVFVAYKFGALKKWKEYYSTVLYVIIGDLSYNFIFYNHTLWQYENLISHTFSTFLVSFITFPCMVLLFLSHYPKCFGKQVFYMVCFVLGNSLIELTSHMTGYITYHNNWNLFWSIGVFLFMFILIRLHYKHPLIAWPISAGFALLTMLIFKIPFHIIK